MSLPEIFTAILRASCLGSTALLLMLALRRAAGKSLSPGARCWLWLPVAILFVMPRLPDLGFGWKETRPAVVVHEWLDAKPLPILAAPHLKSEALTAPVTSPITKSPLIIPRRQWMAWMWPAGAAALFGLWLASYTCLLKRVFRGRKPAREPLRLLLANCAHEAGLRKAPRLVVTDALENPAVAGLLRPVVLVPDKLSTLLTSDELRLVLQHEVWHLKRRVLWCQCLSAVLLAVHWFNPLLWIAMRIFRADREAACDAAVLSTCREDRRGFYGDTLLKLQSQLARAFSLSPAIGVLGGADLLKARIVDIANFGRGSRRAGALAAIVVVLGAVALAVCGSEPGKDAPSSSSPAEENVALQPQAPAVSEAAKKQEVLRRIDELAGVLPLQVYLTSRFVGFTASKDWGDPANWLRRVPSGKRWDQPIATRPLHDHDHTDPRLKGPRLEYIAAFSDPEFQVIMRALSQGSGAGIPSFSEGFKSALSEGHPNIHFGPSVTMRSGQRGTVEVVREFIYPTEFERQDSKEPAGNPTMVPTKFNMVPLGFQMDALPIVDPKTLGISLRVAPKISAFLKWQEFKSADGQSLRNPIFGFSKGDETTNFLDGQTVAFVSYAYQAAFSNFDKKGEDFAAHPAGDALCPALVFVTAKIIDPSGKDATPQSAQFRGIVIPSLQLKNVSLEDAVSEICDLARKNDARGKGVNVIVRHSDTAVPHVTLSMADVTVSALLDVLATSARLNLSVEGQTVFLDAKAEEKELPTATTTFGQRSFLKGDLIDILEVRATSSRFEVGDQVKVKGRYQLSSHNAASISLFTTQTQGDGHEATDPSQSIRAESGTHEFELSCTIRKKGYLHVSFYDLEHGQGFGGVYFGSARQMEEFNVGDWPAGASGGMPIPLLPFEKPVLEFRPNNPPVIPNKR